ncbi:MAG: DUF4340 domain-containing protein [Treponema sp.]|nr:DUF4340 domain-containing protein [Treponema sp.]
MENTGSNTDYRRRLLFHAALAAILALAWLLLVFFDPGRLSARKASYAWLSAGAKDAADRIDIIPAADTGREAVTLVRRGGLWRAVRGGRDYPARDARVDDFLSAFTARGDYSRLYSSASSAARLGLDGDRASRVLVRGGSGPPLLDLLVGNADSTGRNVYLRRPGESEIRLGEDRFSGYIFSAPSLWYDLALTGETDTSLVQRITVSPPRGGPPGGVRVFSRSGNGWIIDGVRKPGRAASENYARTLVTVLAGDFSEEDPQDAFFNDGSIVIETGSNRIYTIRFGPADESGRRLARVYVSAGGENAARPYVYVMPEWTMGRLFRDAGFFESED